MEQQFCHASFGYKREITDTEINRRGTTRGTGTIYTGGRNQGISSKFPDTTNLPYSCRRSIAIYPPHPHNLHILLLSHVTSSKVGNLEIIKLEIRMLNANIPRVCETKPKFNRTSVATGIKDRTM